MASIFSKIIAGNVPGYIIHQDDATCALLDINPRQEGHTLVVPKREVEDLFDLPEEEYHALWATCRRVAEVLKKDTGCARVGIIVAGYEVPHAHVHLIPTNSAEDIPFPPPDQKATGRLMATAERLRRVLE